MRNGCLSVNKVEQWGTGFIKVKSELEFYPNIELEINDDSNFTQIRFVKKETTQETTKEHLASLKKEDKIERVGSTKSGYWKVLEN